MAANKYKNYRTPKKKTDYLSWILQFYVLLIGAGLPLIVQDYYFNILATKYIYFISCTILMSVSLLIYYLLSGKKAVNLNPENDSQRKGRPKSFATPQITSQPARGRRAIWKKMSIADYFVLAYFGTALLSTITSVYPKEAFWGNEGRQTGLFLITWYVVAYFCVSRFWKFKSWVFDAFLAAGLFVCLFGITDYFQMDIFHFKVEMLPEQRLIFTSTIGNINTYTAYVGMFAAVAAVLFGTSRDRKRTVWYFACMIVGFFSMIMGISDNAYLSLAALFGFLPLYLWKDNRGIGRYLMMLATFFSVISCIGWLNLAFREKVLGIDSVFRLIIGFKGLPYITIGLWGISLLWYVVSVKTKMTEKEYGNKQRFAWLGVVLAVFVAVFYIFYDCNGAGHAGKYGSLGSYFLFNDEWGTGRGYIWRNAMERFFELPFWKQLIGYGPETFGILLLKKTANNPFNRVFDNAHNEYLHCLLTVGIAGLISYTAFLTASIARCFKEKNVTPYKVAAAFAVTI